MNLTTTTQISEKHGIPARTIRERARQRGLTPAAVAGVTELWRPAQVEKLIVAGKKGRKKKPK